MDLADFFTRYEFRRKIVHFTLGIFLVIFINSNLQNYEQIMVFFLIALILAIIISVYTRYKKPKLVIYLLGKFDKPKDLKKFPAKGAVFYLIGVIIALALFELDIASASILILAVGDPISHMIGRYYGKTKIVINQKKLLEGTLVGILCGTLAASFFVPVPLAFFGAAFGMMAEAIELEFLNLDDNFFIPFVSGLVMSLIKGLL
jgi:dolichol kinase